MTPRSDLAKRWNRPFRLHPACPICGQVVLHQDDAAAHPAGTQAGQEWGDDMTAASPRYYQAIIKINPTDTPERQAGDIADGIGYACALLLDEHGWSAEQVADLLERVTDEVADSEAQRGV